MSLNLKSSGGGSVTVDVPSTASNYTATLPAANGTVQVSGAIPAFSASFSTDQSISNTTFTKAAFNTVAFDTASCYNNTTYRFTPNVAGYYQVNLMLRPNASTNGTIFISSIYKNGSEFLRCDSRQTATGFSCVVSCLMYFNGTTDYIEPYGYISGTGTLIFAGGSTGPYSNFSATLVRAA